jgi:uncharacterized protein YjiS (DUF1127 family)
MAAWRRQQRDQKLLQHLDERALRDLGIDRAPITREDAVPSWRLDRFTP